LGYGKDKNLLCNSFNKILILNNMIEERYIDYDKKHCWQYDIRLKNYNSDLIENNLTIEYVNGLKVSDFQFKNITNKKEQRKLINFIKKNEWLGTLSQFTTHWFGAYHKDILSGVILFNVPNSFSKLLGENTKNIERLISRGACISWSPKNLGSSFLMWCINWMVKNTEYRLFTAYSDPTAMELGTIYQATNFYYLGNGSKTTTKYLNPYSDKWVSDRFFRQKTAYRKYCKELGVEWCSNWQHKTGMNWHNMSKETEMMLREYSKKKQNEAEKIILRSKHKYVYVLGKTKKETKELRKIFEERNRIFEYPKIRGE
jgi:hypothetical protein